VHLQFRIERQRESVKGVNHGGQGEQSPEFGVGGRYCILSHQDFVMFQNFKHQKTTWNSSKHAISSKNFIVFWEGARHPLQTLWRWEGYPAPTPNPLPQPSLLDQPLHPPEFQFRFMSVRVVSQQKKMTWRADQLSRRKTVLSMTPSWLTLAIAQDSFVFIQCTLIVLGLRNHWQTVRNSNGHK